MFSTTIFVDTSFLILLIILTNEIKRTFTMIHFSFGSGCHYLNYKFISIKTIEERANNCKVFHKRNH